MASKSHFWFKSYVDFVDRVELHREGSAPAAGAAGLFKGKGRQPRVAALDRKYLFTLLISSLVVGIYL